VNLVGTLASQSKNFLVVFKSAVKNKRKIKEKQIYLRKICFRKKLILVIGVTLKQMNAYA